MSKLELLCEPSNFIEFIGDQNSEIFSTLKLTNNNNFNVAFKIKTTSPPSYVVKPSSGVIPLNTSLVSKLVIIIC